MKAEEIRLGNCVYVTDYDRLKVHRWKVQDFLIFENNKSEYKPIPLNKEWMLRLGFLESGNDFKLYLNKDDQYYFINMLFQSFPLVFEIDGNRMSLPNIRYVHQIQNLYFALEGEEIKIK